MNTLVGNRSLVLVVLVHDRLLALNVCPSKTGSVTSSFGA